MLKETIEFVNFNGEAESDDFYFHLTEADLARINLSKVDMEEYITRIVKAQNGEEIVALFEKLIKESHGVKSLDGKRFIKNAQNLEDFTSSDAYNKFFIKLVTNAEFGAKFVSGIMPPELLVAAQAKQKLQDNPGISANLAAHLDVQDEPFNVSATLAVVPEPQLTAKQFQGQEPVAGPIFDETTGPTPAEQKVKEILSKHPKDMSKPELIMAMRLKNAKGKVLTWNDVTAMAPDELELMQAAGATVEGF